MVGVADGTVERETRRRPALVDVRADAFRRLVDRQLDAAYRLATVILDDPIEAEDAVHDAAVSAWTRFAQLRETSRFDAWFTRILVNSCRDRLRTKARRRVTDIGRDLEESEHPRIADASEATAFRDELGAAVNELSPDERLIVTLRYGSDLTMPAIAQLLGVPEGTAKSRLHHVLARLRTVLGERNR